MVFGAKFVVSEGEGLTLEPTQSSHSELCAATFYITDRTEKASDIEASDIRKW